MIGETDALPEAVRWRYTRPMDLQPPKGPGRLPPPPAPTARDANPWKFSATARIERPEEPTGYERLLAELEQARAEREGEGEAQAPPSEPVAEDDAEAASRRGSALNRVFPLVILLVMVGSFAREVIEQEGYDDPRLGIVAAVAVAVVIAAVVLALRKSRRRRPRR